MNRRRWPPAWSTGTWTLRQPFDGIYLWRDPHGQIYLVDHTGTHQIKHYDPVVQVSPGPTIVLDLGAAG